MTRFLLGCVWHPRLWRACWEEYMKRDPLIERYRDQRTAAVLATREELRDLPPSDPITDAVRGKR